jgi:hypothetical protein
MSLILLGRTVMYWRVQADGRGVAGPIVRELRRPAAT